MVKSLIAAALILLGLLFAAGNCSENQLRERSQKPDVLASLLTGQASSYRVNPTPQPVPSDSETSEICAARNWTPTTTDVFQATVTRITEGDTLEALAQGQTIEIRLWGIDAPERDQPRGEKARNMLSRLAPLNKLVTVHAYGLDKYGRILAVLDGNAGLAINAVMVEEGLAYHSKAGMALGHTCLTSMEQFARTYRRGVWEDSPQGDKRPWAHRQEIAEESYPMP